MFAVVFIAYYFKPRKYGKLLITMGFFKGNFLLSASQYLKLLGCFLMLVYSSFRLIKGILIDIVVLRKILKQINYKLLYSWAYSLSQPLRISFDRSGGRAPG